MPEAVQSLGEAAAEASQRGHLWAGLKIEGPGSSPALWGGGRGGASGLEGCLSKCRRVYANWRSVLRVGNDRNSPLRRHISQDVQLKGYQGRLQGGGGAGSGNCREDRTWMGSRVQLADAE